jgi:hypothetical protein
MIQNTIVILLIAGALVHVFYGLKKIVVRKKNALPTCGGCSQCKIKKNLIRHGQQESFY